MLPVPFGMEKAPSPPLLRDTQRTQYPESMSTAEGSGRIFRALERPVDAAVNSRVSRRELRVPGSRGAAPHDVIQDYVSFDFISKKRAPESPALLGLALGLPEHVWTGS